MKKIFFFIFLGTIALSLFCQEQTNGVFAPFVSRLKASTSGNKIVLTWKNSEDVSGIKLVYRYTEEITEINYSMATLIASVEEDVESYTDTPPSPDEYYYAILIQDREGKLYRLFIPYRNKTTASVAITSIATEEDLSTQITSLSAQVINDYILITFISSKSDRDLILYRSSQPIINQSDLTDTTFSLALVAGTTRYEDRPIAGVDYYYAVVDAGLVKSGESAFILGQNTLSKSVQIPISDSTMGIYVSAIRSFPLPALNILYNVESGKELITPAPFMLPQKVKIKEATSEIIKKQLAKMKFQTPQEIGIHILSIDKAETAGGEDYLLQKIIFQYLSNDQYIECEYQLKNFLNTYHSKLVKARAHFYLGQAYFFQTKYREAFLEFLLAQENYYTEVQIWIDRCFKKLTE